MSTGFAPKVQTKEFDLAEYGGEGKLKIRGLNTRISKDIAKEMEKLGNISGDSPSGNIEEAILILLNCIVEAPFEIKRETIEEFPPEFTIALASECLTIQSKFPLP